MFPAVTREGKVVKVFEPVSSGDSGSFSLAHTRLSFFRFGVQNGWSNPQIPQSQGVGGGGSMETEGVKTEKESV